MISDTIVSRRCISEEQTARFAQELEKYLKLGDVVALSGTLGAGKTAFARALIQNRFGTDVDVPSPTFNLLIIYDDGPNDIPIYHYDMYRVEEPEEVFELGLEDALDTGICLIEWADRMGPYLPDDPLRVSIEYPTEDEEGVRIISLAGSARWKKRLNGLSADE